MRIKSLAVPAITFALAMSILPAVSTVSAEPDRPTCYDAVHSIEVPATKWLDSPGTLIGTSGDDVLVGSTGSDIIKGIGGNDLICTAPYPTNFGDYDQVDGGTGRDRIFGFGTLDGGSGDDEVYVYFSPSVGKGGPGNDFLYVSYGATGDGGTGNDELFSDGASSLEGGSGNDYLSGSDAGSMSGSSGNDTIINSSGNPAIDCGSGRDSFSANGASVVKSCESTIRPT